MRNAEIFLREGKIYENKASQGSIFKHCKNIKNVFNASAIFRHVPVGRATNRAAWDALCLGPSLFRQVSTECSWWHSIHFKVDLCLKPFLYPPLKVHPPLLSMLYFPCEKLSAPSDLGLITTAMEKVPNATSRDITNEGKEKKKIWLCIKTLSY